MIEEYTNTKKIKNSNQNNEEDKKLNFISEENKISKDNEGEFISRINGAMDFSPVTDFSKLIKIPGIFIITAVIAYTIGYYKLRPFYLLLLCYTIYFLFKRRAEQYCLYIKNYYSGFRRREMIKEKESVEWLNYILRELWKISESKISSEIHSNANEELRKIKVKGIRRIRLSECTLGTQPPEVDYISFMENNESSIKIEFGISFIPIQDEELHTKYEGKKSTSNSQRSMGQWNSLIQLNCDINNYISIPILVRNFTFSAKLKIEIFLKNDIPFLKSIKIQSLELPIIDFVLIPMNFLDIMDLPFIKKMLFVTLNNKMTNLIIKPNFLNFSIDELIPLNNDNRPDIVKKRIGILRIQVNSLINPSLNSNVNSNLSYDEGPRYIRFDADGKTYGVTEKVEGVNPIFNVEFFNIIINNTTLTVDLTLHYDITSGNVKKKYGKIWLKNLNNKHFYTENVNMASEDGNLILNVTSSFYPLVSINKENLKDENANSQEKASKEEKKNKGDIANSALKYSNNSEFMDSGIIKLNIIGIKNLTIKDKFKSVLYNTYLLVNIIQSSTKFIEYTFESKRVFSSRDPDFYILIEYFLKDFSLYYIEILVMDDRTSSELGEVRIALSDISSLYLNRFNINNVESGEVLLRLNYEYVDLSGCGFIPGLFSSPKTNKKNKFPNKMGKEIVVTDERLGINDSSIKDVSSNNIAGKEDIIPIEENNEDTKSIKSTGNTEFLENSIGINHTVSKESLMVGITNFKINLNQVYHFIKCIKIKICDIIEMDGMGELRNNKIGNYYLIFETIAGNFKMEPFSVCLGLSSIHSIVFPITAYDSLIKARLFKITKNGDLLISEEIMEIDKESQIDENENSNEIINEGINENSNEIINEGINENENSNEIINEGINENENSKETINEGISENENSKETINEGEEIINEGISENENSRETINEGEEIINEGISENENSRETINEGEEIIGDDNVSINETNNPSHENLTEFTDETTIYEGFECSNFVEEHKDINKNAGEPKNVSKVIIFDKIKIKFIIFETCIHKGIVGKDSYKFVQLEFTKVLKKLLMLDYFRPNHISFLNEIMAMNLFILKGSNNTISKDLTQLNFNSLKLGKASKYGNEKNNSDFFTLRQVKIFKREITNIINSNIKSRIDSCDFKYEDLRVWGNLMVYIIKCERISNSEEGARSKGSYYVDVSLNSERVYSTLIKRNTPSPTFNEGFEIPINRHVDFLIFTIHDNNLLGSQSILYFKKVFLFNLEEGYKNYNLSMDLLNPNLNCYDNTCLKVVFSFKYL